jgi:hypothetical protein
MDPVSVVSLVAATAQPAGLRFTVSQSLNKEALQTACHDFTNSYDSEDSPTSQTLEDIQS